MPPVLAEVGTDFRGEALLGDATVATTGAPSAVAGRRGDEVLSATVELLCGDEDPPKAETTALLDRADETRGDAPVAEAEPR